LDKLEALIQHNESDIKTWIPLEYNLQMTYGNEQVKFSDYLTELREQVRADSVRKIEKSVH
jgi:putative hydrolase of HD superfamily